MENVGGDHGSEIVIIVEQLQKMQKAGEKDCKYTRRNIS